MPYTAPTPDILFALEHAAHIHGMAQWPAFQEINAATVQAVLTECARLHESVLAPLNQIGDTHPPVFHDGHVTTSPGFAQAYAQFVQGGWQGLPHPVEHGGQGLPKALAAACAEMLNSANMSFALCPLLTDGAIEALRIAASPQVQAMYLGRLVAGEWTGTMNLTESQAGSDLAAVRTRAQPQADGTYRVFGNKIFITYGEHDMAANIVHLVLARLPDAPAGVKGLSLLVCPKYLVQADGSLGERNDVHCMGLEHKLGIHASPTALLQLGGGVTQPGGQAGAVGHLVGQAHRGLEYMFIMMNAARFAVGVQGVAMAERAYQQALAYARTRVQGRPVDGSSAGSVPIVQHPDVRRMLLHMRATTQGCRAMAYTAAAAYDAAHHHPDAAVREQQASRYEWLVPLVKGYSTQMAVEVASLGVQVHGGMGFIEATGAAQHYRDARILTIYEGTTAIQANDFVSRKTVRDGGHAARQLAQDITHTEQLLHRCPSPQAATIARHLTAARVAWEAVVEWVVAHAATQPNAVYAGSVAYLMLSGTLVVGWQLARLFLAAHQQPTGASPDGLLQAQMANAHFFADHVVIHVPALAATVMHGASSVLGDGVAL